MFGFPAPPLSKIEAGRATLIVEPFDLGELLNDVRLMFQELTGKKGLTLAFEQDPQLPRALAGDAVKVRQVLINLLSNAVKFTERGRVTVRPSSRAGAAPGRHIVAIAVEDSGPGIEARNLARIFHAFDQADSKMRAGGTGLGLAISRAFARMMNGDIVVDQHAGEGQCVHVHVRSRHRIETVPFRRPTCSRCPTGLEPDQPAWKVLIVDDVQTNRDLLDELLSRVGL